jgi:hypothetical protein
VFGRAAAKDIKESSGGDAILHSLRSPKVAARFWVKVDRSDPDRCWHWKASTRNGYGIFCIGAREVYAHRYAHMLTNGPIPDGLSILHACDVPACVNPRHLRAGTNTENAQDRVDRNRLPRGENHPASKLTDSDVIAIRAATEPNRDLAKRYGVARQTIDDIRALRRWKHVGRREG